MNITKQDMDTILAIVERADELSRTLDQGGVDRLSLTMDLEATHASCPLQLEALLMADNGNFAHDVFGIRRHMNRETGKLGDCFMPRFAEV